MDMKRVDTSLKVKEWKRLVLAAKRSNSTQKEFVRGAIKFYLNAIKA